MMKRLTPLAFALLVLGGLLTGALAGTSPAAEENASEASDPLKTEGESAEPGSDVFMTLPEVFVYAQKMQQDIRKVPTSIVNYSSQEIADAGIKDMADVFSRTPGLSELKGSRHSAGTILSMRGIISGNSDYANPSVGMFVDGAYVSGGYDSDLYDVESVEVLRGPQGTLFGGNSMAGVFLIRSRQPDFDWGGHLSTGYGSYNTFTLDSAVGGPITDRLAFRVAGLYRTTDGYFKNEVTDSDGEKGEDFNLRGQLLWKINSRWSVNLNLNGHKYNGNYSNLATTTQAADHPYKTYAPNDGHAKQDSFGQIFTVNYSGDDVAFTSITNHRRFNSDELVSINLNGYYDAFLNNSKFRTDAWTQEFRLSSPDADSRFTWLAGVYGSYEEQTTKSWNDQGLTTDWGGFPYTLARNNEGKVTVDAWNAAVFGQATLGLTDKLYASAGLRYDYVKKKLNSSFSQTDRYTYGGYPAGSSGINTAYDGVSKDWNTLLPKFSLEYRFTPDISTYATVSRGYKPGGFQPFNPQWAGLGYDPEYSWNYELGVKGRFFGDRLEANLAGFYIDTRDLQFNTLIEGGTVGSISNAGKGRSRGVELDLKAMVFDGLQLFASGAYTDAEMRDIDENVATGTFSGARVPYVPELKTTVGAQYSFDSGLFMRAENTYTSNYYVDAGNTIRQGGFSVTNLKLGYEKDGYSIIAYADNVFGKKYYVYGHVDSMANVQVVRLGAPRTVGVTLKYEF